MQQIINQSATALPGKNKIQDCCLSIETKIKDCKRLFIAFFLILCIYGIPPGISAGVLPGLPDAETPLQQGHYQSIPTASEIDSYLQSIADQSIYATSVRIGNSVQNRPIRAVLISNDPEFLANGSQSAGKMTVMLVGSQHPSEASGAEALQILAHELSLGSLGYMLSTLNVVIIADSNPDGRSLKRRTNANKVNLSTDYVLLSQPESKAIADSLIKYQPHAVIDLHESAVWKKSSLGKEGYMTDFETQIEGGNQANIDGQLQSFSYGTFLPRLIQEINLRGLRASHYIGEIISTRQTIQHGGFTLRNLRNYSAYRGSLSILIENRIDPPGDYPSYRNIKLRTEKQFLSVEVSLEMLSRFKNEIIALSEQARSNRRDAGGGHNLFLQSRYVEDPAQPAISLPLRNIEKGRNEPVVFANSTIITKSVPILLAPYYAVTAEQGWVKSLLEKHKIDYKLIDSPMDAEAVVQQVVKVTLSPKRTIKGRVITRQMDVEIVETPKQIKLAAGDLLIDTAQPMARFVVDAFDPRSSSSVFNSAQYTLLLLRYENFFVSPVTKLF